jgi:fatty acid synthase subunit alpha
LQNEITGDLDTEFGSAPDGAEDIPLKELASMLQKSFFGQLGRRTKSMVDKLFTSKMPGGFTLTKVRSNLEQEYGFGVGRQDSVLLSSLQSPPAARLDSEGKAREYWSSIVQSYISTTGIQIQKASTSSGAATAVVSIDPKTLDALTKRNDDFNREIHEAYAKHVGDKSGSSSEELAKMRNDMNHLQAELDLWNVEHGNEYASGIKPLFNRRKARQYDSYWNWAVQDVFQIYHGIRQGTIRINDEDLVSRRQALINRSCSRLTFALAHMLAELKTEKSQPLKVVSWFSDLLADCQAALQKPPAFIPSATLTTPRTTIDANGVVSFVEEPVARVRTFEPQALEAAIVAKDAKGEITNINVNVRVQNLEVPWSDASSVTEVPTSGPRFNCIPQIQKKTGGSWKDSTPLTDEYATVLNGATSKGLEFSGRNVLITGAGQGSIGSKILQGLLAGGARVVVTTSSYSRKTTKHYQEMFSKFGAKGSSLLVVPFNQGSQQDTEALIDYIYSIGDSEWDLDHVIPFAAISELSNGVELGSKSELAHRMMLTNTLRLLGAIKKAKEARRIDTRPAQVILPLSPNHGVFGGDGLYSESKLGLEGTLNKWHTEDWADYLSICGAIIGWTRGTKLMNDNDIVAEGVEALGLKTFSQDEMALNVLGLMTSPLLQICQTEPLLADLSGGMCSIPNLKDEVATIRSEIKDISASRRAIVRELQAEHGTSISNSNAFPAFAQRANIKFDFPKLPNFASEVEQLSELEGMIDLEKVVVVCGYGEVGPHGSSRTRWQMEAHGELSLEGHIEMAWMMGLIEYQSTEGVPHRGWIDKASRQPIMDLDIKKKYEEHILKHSGIRFLDARSLDGPDPSARQVLHEIDLQSDFAPFEVSKETAMDLIREHGNKVTITDVDDHCIAVLRKGARLMVPKALTFDRTVGGQVPTGWCARTYGIAEDIINQVDPATLYALVCTAEALLSAGITDPYEFYKYIHVSQLGVAVGSGFGGAASLQGIYKERFMDRPVQNDVLAESFINTGSAWINMLLLSSAGPNITPVGACATALESLDVGYEVISSGKAKAVLVGGYDYLAKDVAYEFANMKATNSAVDDLARGRDPQEMSRPTTSTRSGFVESEGCGIQVLTTAKLALEMGLPIHGIIAMTRTASDKAGRSLPAPGHGIMTASAQSKGQAFDSPLMSMAYRQRQISLRMTQIKATEDSELAFLEEELTSYKSGAVDFDLDGFRKHRTTAIISESQTQRQETMNTYGNNFWKRDTRISPMRGALATWGLTIDDLSVASFHGTSTVKNELNECAVIQEQMMQLGRTRGNPVQAVFQKHLTGHPKGAAAAWMLNGCLQIMDTGLVPGNRNADNIDAELEKFDHIAFPSETVKSSTGVKAFIVSSFGFGQKGAQAIGIHPKYLFAAAGKEQYESYRVKLDKRQKKAYQHFQKSMMTNSMFKAKDAPPYAVAQETEFLTNTDARLPMDMQLE